MYIIIQAILPIFLLILVGVIVEILLRDRIETPKYLVWLGCSENSWISGLNGYALYLALPSLIFISLAGIEKDQILSPQIIGINILLLLVVILITTLVVHATRLKKDIANAYIVGIFFGQVAYLGFPFLDSLIPGSVGLVSMHVAIHVGIAFTILLGVLEYQKTGKPNIVIILKNLFKNPLLISVILGLIWLLFNLPINDRIYKALSMLATSASPVVLIAIGMFMGRKLKIDRKFGHSIIIAGGKIIMMPILFLLVGFFSKMPSGYSISIILSGMPVALTCFALSEIYDINKKIIVDAIILSTVGSIISLSLISFLVI